MLFWRNQWEHMMNNYSNRSLIAVLFVVTLISGVATSTLSQTNQKQLAIRSTRSSEPTAESKAERDQRMKWWREARFGMFIHWGLYAVPAGEYTGKRSERIGEWIMDWASIPRVEYEKFAPKFNPVKFDAREWVRIAKEAGMKYIVI